MAKANNQNKKGTNKWILIAIVILILLLWCFFFGPCSQKTTSLSLGCTQEKALKSTKDYIQKFDKFDWPTVRKIEMAKYTTNLDPGFLNAEVETKNPSAEVKNRMKEYDIYKYIFTLSAPPKSTREEPFTEPYSLVIVNQENCKVLNSVHGLYYSKANIFNQPLEEIPKNQWP